LILLRISGQGGQAAGGDLPPARVDPPPDERRPAPDWNFQFGMDSVGGSIQIQDEEGGFQANVGECSRWMAIMWVLLLIVFCVSLLWTLDTYARNEAAL
jgi:hypothetical protein